MILRLSRSSLGASDRLAPCLPTRSGLCCPRPGPVSLEVYPCTCRVLTVAWHAHRAEAGEGNFSPDPPRRRPTPGTKTFKDVGKGVADGVELSVVELGGKVARLQSHIVWIPCTCRVFTGAWLHLRTEEGEGNLVPDPPRRMPISGIKDVGQFLAGRVEFGVKLGEEVFFLQTHTATHPSMGWHPISSSGRQDGVRWEIWLGNPHYFYPEKWWWCSFPAHTFRESLLPENPPPPHCTTHRHNP